MTDSNSYANLPVNCTSMSQKTRHHNLENSFHHKGHTFDQGSSHVIACCQLLRKGNTLKAGFSSRRFAISASTAAGYDDGLRPLGKCFWNPNIDFKSQRVSDDGGEKTKRLRGKGKGQFKATCLIGHGRCSRQTIHNVLPSYPRGRNHKSAAGHWTDEGYFPFHFLGNVKLLSILLNRK